MTELCRTEFHACATCEKCIQSIVNMMTMCFKSVFFKVKNTKSALYYIFLQCITFSCTVLHFSAMYHIFLHCITFSYTVLHFPTLYYIFLHCITFSCDVLHFPTLYCIKTALFSTNQNAVNIT